MKLKLDREDLLPIHINMACSATKFEHFKPEVQAAIAAVGKATFYSHEGTKYENYNVIYPDAEQNHEG